MGEPGLGTYKADETIVYPERYPPKDEEEEDEDEDEETEGVFEEAPTRPMYMEAGRQFMPELQGNERRLPSLVNLTFFLLSVYFILCSCSVFTSCIALLYNNHLSSHFADQKHIVES